MLLKPVEIIIVGRLWNTNYEAFFPSYIGLSLVLNIEANEYLGDFSESYGAVVDVTSSNEMHFPEENGYLVAPGQVTNVALTGVSVQSCM